MTGYDRLTYEVRDGIASITLNRPDETSAIAAAAAAPEGQEGMCAPRSNLISIVSPPSLTV